MAPVGPQSGPSRAPVGPQSGPSPTKISIFGNFSIFFSKILQNTQNARRKKFVSQSGPSRAPVPQFWVERPPTPKPRLCCQLDVRFLFFRFRRKPPKFFTIRRKANFFNLRRKKKCKVHPFPYRNDTFYCSLDVNIFFFRRKLQ